ncbi:hypothetical protein C8J55DRAFT_515881 [Lentinula edodes]|uniref:Signal transducer n=1 Tax=Lentinula lateritia TaxID=40482 RepID=A0A9W9A856_9AGAR|nr:hypothetical protein C8J55DRAFT_515881 [Lentinula edodes]
MIAAMNPAVSQQQQYPMPDDLEERLCPGCKLSVVSEEGGLVVAFGQCFFHVNCFKCAKCNDKVTADTNLLLLSDGSPICANCSYACNVCKQPILDEAIMTGDDAYHAHCFKCKVCKNRIDELVFAKTSQGIYCMDCHNERMIKIRKHTQKKAERDRERQAAQAAAYNELGVGGANKGGSVSTSYRDRELRAREMLGKDTSSQTLQSSRSTEFSLNGHPSHPLRAPHANKASEFSRNNQSSVFHPPPRTSSVDSASQRPTPSKNHSMPVALEEPSLSNHPAVPSLSVPLTTNVGLHVTSTRDKRRSINPDLVIKPPGEPSTASSSLSPIQREQPSPVNDLFGGSPTSVKATSPFRENFPSSRPSSAASNNSANVHRQRSRPTSAMSSSSVGAATSTNGDESTVTMRPSPSPLRPTTPHVSSSTRPNSANSLQKPERFSGRLSSRPGSAAGRDRPPSRADVPRSVESATDEDDDDEEKQEIKGSRFDRAPQRSMTDDSAKYSLIDAYSGVAADSTTYTDKEPHQRTFSVESVPPMPPPKDSKVGPPAPLSTLPKRVSSSSHGPISAMSDPPSLTPEPHALLSVPSPKSLNTPTGTAGLSVPVISRNDSSHSNTSASTSGPGEASDTETTETTAEDKELLDAEIEAEENGEESGNRATATFIAPALPPIRFSLNAADFSDLFTSVGGNMNSLKNFDTLATVAENHTSERKLWDITPSTPPPSAASVQPNTMSQTLNVQSVRVVPDLPGPEPTSSSTLMPVHNDFSSSVYSSAHDPASVVGTAEESVPNSEDGHSSNSDHHSKKEKGGLLRKVSFGKRNKLDRSASSSRALREREKRVTEAMPVPLNSKAGLTAPPLSRTISEPQVKNISDETLPSTTIMVSPPADAKEEAKEPISAADLVLQRLQDVLADAIDRGAQQMKFDRGFVEAIVNAMATKKADYVEARKQIDSMKRASKQYIDGISVAQTEYDRELKARRDAEAEVTRLRVLLSGQAARLTALTGDSRRQELRQQMSKELHENLNGLERDLSKLKVERDVTLAEVEELNAVSSISGVTSEPPANLSRSLTKRLDNLKSQYQRDLVPLTQQREALTREVMELKAARDVFLEETTVLNARNEELAQLSAQYSRRAAMAPPNAPSNSNGTETPSKNIGPMIVETPVRIDSRNIQQQQTPQQTHQLSAYSSVEEFDARKTKVEETHTPSRGPVKVFKWGSRAKEVSAPIAQSVTEKVKIGHMEHSFQPLSLLRFTRCDHCGEKMWGSQLRCMGCSISVHTRCVNQVHSACSPQTHNSNGGGNNEDSQLLPPSMFGRDLIEQVLADAKGGSRKVPVIVEKCIEAVEKLAMDYEGIYRKTGGSGQSRIITQLFERGDYQAFDLLDSDRFNDICSVTSVLKTYLRSLPVPLLTHDLHDQFMSAVEIRDPALKNSTLTELVNNLPPEHYHTVRMLMLHLNRICQLSEVNLMNARNLGVVFGPTLMRSRNPGAEFSDMAGKALSIEWLVESAPQVFNTPTDL